jgi:hypothetical protein
MIEGFKILFTRIIIGVMIILGFKPIANYFVGFADSTEVTYFGGALDIIKMGLNNINVIVLLGVVAAVIHIYYRTVQKRKYESQYEEYYGGYK